ncbi:hypothetical protein ABPG75_001918 [Micractinium tetrahymenae]
MLPLPGATARAASAPTSAYYGTSGRLGSPWCSQPGWRGGPVAPRRRWRQRQQQRRGQQQTQAALLDPPPFDPAKLRVEYLTGGREAGLSAGPRRYTLTHNDVTGSLQLSIGREYNRQQLDGWYTRIVRDEILAEWQDTAPPAAGRTCAAGGGRDPRPSLHVYCHVSGEELWPAPPQLRSFIFQREMTLVLDTIAHAEGGPGGLLAAAPSLRSAPVYVHLRSDLPALDRVVEWGVLGDRSTWRTAQSSVLRSLMSSVLGTLDEADATDGSNGSWSPSSFSSASASWDELGGGGPGAAAAGGWEADGNWDGPPTAVTSRRRSSSEGTEQQQQQLQLHPSPEQQQQQQQITCNGAAAVPSQPAAAAAVAAAGALASSSAAGSLVAVNGGSSSSSGPSSSGGLGAAANSAVSLATAQQQAGERAASAWLAGDALPRMPAVKAAASRQR